jgi:hypothetical protein
MRTQETLDGLVTALVATCGDLFAACKTCGVSLHFVSNWCKDDEEVREKIEEARNIGYMGLEHAAYKRAVHGVQKGVYYQGAEVAQETVYSDGLLVKLLEANVPKYSKQQDGRNTYNGPVQINNNPRAENFQEWLAMAAQTKMAQDEVLAAKQLAFKEPVIEAEFVDVPDNMEGWRI